MPEPDSTAPSKSGSPWPLTIALLIVAYPIGLIALWKKPRRNLWSKPLAAIFTLPLFALFVLFLLRPFWDFPGSVTSFSIDLTKGFLHWRELESDRAAQKNNQQASDAPRLNDRWTWTDFRGPNRDGISPSQPLSTNWANAKPLYRQPIGEGYASFVVAHGLAYTIEQRRKDEAVTCYDYLTGRELWAFAYPANFDEVLGGRGPRATPTLFNDQLYALGAQGDLNCLDAATGRPIWHHNILQENHATNLEWALSGAPLIVDDKVLVAGSGNPNPSIFAFDAATGTPRWTSATGTQAYTSLTLATLCGKQQVLNFAHVALNSIDPTDGKLLWTFPWTMHQGPTCAQPILAGKDRVFISSGYDKGCALLQLELIDGKLRPREIWTNKFMKNKFASSIIFSGHIYGLHEGILTCLDLETGERKWKAGRYSHGSLLLVDNHLLILSEEGRLALVDADPREYKERTSLQIFDDRTWNNFVLLDGRLLARNHKQMACYDLRLLMYPASSN